MSAMAEVKFRISAQQKTLLDERCKDMGVTRSYRLCQLVDAELEDRIVSVPQEPTKPISQKSNGQFVKFERELKYSFAMCDQRIKKVVNIVEALPTAKDVEKFGRSTQAIATKLDLLSIPVPAEQSLPIYKQPIFYLGSIATFLAIVAIVMLIPGGSAPARSIAKFALGKESNFAAAMELITDPPLRFSIVHSAIFAQHRGYQEDLTACAKKARKAKKQFLCTMRIPAALGKD